MCFEPFSVDFTPIYAAFNLVPVKGLHLFFRAASPLLQEPCYNCVCLLTMFICCIRVVIEMRRFESLTCSHDWWQSGSVQSVCRFPKEQAWYAWERGLSFPVPSGVLGFLLTPCPGLLPSYSVSFPSAAETSPGKCSQ